MFFIKQINRGKSRVIFFYRNTTSISHKSDLLAYMSLHKLSIIDNNVYEINHLVARTGWNSFLDDKILLHTYKIAQINLDTIVNLFSVHPHA